MPEAIPGISQLKGAVKERDKEIFGLIKEIDTLVSEFRNAAEGEKKNGNNKRDI